MTKHLKLFMMVAFAAVIAACATQNRQTELQEPDFTVKTVTTEATNWWARAMADIDGDGLKDIVLMDNNAHGGRLIWLETQDDTASWKTHLIADSAIIGDDMAGGDIETADVDNDGDIDVFGFVQGGEWASGDPSAIYWFENPDWTPHYIGEAPSFIKDIEMADFDNNGKVDIAVITFNENSFQIFAQNDTGWIEASSQTLTNLHEGMAVGDFDGDGFVDIATNGYWLKSPGEKVTGKWEALTVDSLWFSQDGDWSRNATKNATGDIDNDGKAELFISHSERKGYPVAWYDLVNAQENQWERHILDTIEAAHTLQVADFNNDGKPDLMAGENQMRWGDADTVDPVNIYLNQGDNKFTTFSLTKQGIYNGLAGDFDNDGDADIMRLPGHSDPILELWINTIK